MVSESSVSAFDVAGLANDPSPEKRADVGVKIAARFGNVLITPRERELSQEILALLVHDAAELVVPDVWGAKKHHRGVGAGH